jgi:integrase
MKKKKTQEKSGTFRRAAEGIVKNESSGTYYARFRRKGKRVMKRLGTREHPCTNSNEAKRLLRLLLDDLEKTDVVATKKTLRSLIKEYITGMEFEESTKLYKTHYLGLFQERFATAVRVSEIKKSDVTQFLATFNDKSASTRNKVLTVCRDLFEYAKDDKVIGTSPVDGIKYKAVKDTKTKPVPSWNEFEAIVKSVREVVFSDTSQDSSDLIEFMGLAGLGQAECAGLTWGDVNFNTSTISVIRKKTGTGFKVPIYPQLLPFFKRLKVARKTKSATDHVFKVRDPKKALDSACTRLNLPKYSARDFRKMFITNCIELGIDPQTIAEWQGHKDRGVLIMKVYGKVSPKHQEKMASLLSRPTSKTDPTPATPSSKEA